MLANILLVNLTSTLTKSCLEISRAMASVQHVSAETSLLLLSNGCKLSCFVCSLFKLHPVVVSWTCCNAVALLLLEMAESLKKRRLRNMLKFGPSLSSLLDVTCYMKSWLFCIIPAGITAPARSKLLWEPDSCGVDMSKHLLFCSVHTATFYYN